jgi:hypothetical protein
MTGALKVAAELRSENMKHWTGPLLLAVGLLGCCSGVLWYFFGDPGEKVLYESRLDRYTVTLVRKPPKDFTEHPMLEGAISLNGLLVSGPFWMGAVDDAGETAFGEHRYPEEGVLLIYEQDKPDAILVAVDAKNQLLWPDTGKRATDTETQTGELLLEQVNRRHGTKYYIAEFFLSKKWNFR